MALPVVQGNGPTGGAGGGVERMALPKDKDNATAAMAETAVADRRGGAILLMGGLWAAALVASLPLDRPVASWMREHGVVEWLAARRTLVDIVKAPGNYVMTLALALALWAWHERKVHAAGLVALSGLTAAVSALLKWGVGRTRPFKLGEGFDQPAAFVFQPFRWGLPGLFDQTDLSFPSGHTCVAFATAAALAILLPRWRWVFYGLAGLVGMERVAGNSHYVSDVIGAAGLAVVGVHLIEWGCSRLAPAAVERVVQGAETVSTGQSA